MHVRGPWSKLLGRYFVSVSVAALFNACNPLSYSMPVLRMHEVCIAMLHSSSRLVHYMMMYDRPWNSHARAIRYLPPY